MRIQLLLGAPLLQLCAEGMEHGVFFFFNTHFRLVCKNELSSFVNTFVSITVCSCGGGYDVYPHCCVLRWAVQLLYEGYSIYTELPVATLTTVTKVQLVRSIRGRFSYAEVINRGIIYTNKLHLC